MKDIAKVQIAAGVLAACFNLGGEVAFAAPSLSQPGQEVQKELPRPEAEVVDATPEKPKQAPQVEFTITNFRLEAPDLYLDKGELTKILQDGMGEKKTMVQLNATLTELTRYCRQHGYPAAAAYVPAQESSDGMITIKVIPGRYGEIKIDNRSKLKERVANGFVKNLKPGDIIRTGKLETTLYSISDVSGTKAVGVLSPGKEFGTSDLTVRIEKGKSTNTVLYVENYGSKDTGQYRYGLQENLYDVSGNGDKVSMGVLLSNRKMHNYYANYETIVGRGGTTLGLGISRMDYEAGVGNASLKGTAETLSLYGQRSLYHLSNSGLTVSYGYNYRRLTDENILFNLKTKKHSQSVYVGLEGFERRPGTSLNYQVKVTTGRLGLDSDWARTLNVYNNTEGRYTKGEFSATAVQRLGNRADVLVKASGQLASRNLDGSERMYLGGASGVRAYPQGEGSGDEGIMATVEPRFYTQVPGLIFSTYFDIGYVQYRKDGQPSGRPGSTETGMTLKGYGAALSYTKPNDWFARLDYARRIGGDPNLSEKAKAKGRLWFMLGKIW